MLLHFVPSHNLPFSDSRRSDQIRSFFLEYCTIAGEALNPAVFDTFKKLTGIKLMEGFGQTETTLTVATFPGWNRNREAWESLTPNMMLT